MAPIVASAKRPSVQMSAADVAILVTRSDRFGSSNPRQTARTRYARPRPARNGETKLHGGSGVPKGPTWLVEARLARRKATNATTTPIAATLPRPAETARGDRGLSVASPIP